MLSIGIVGRTCIFFIYFFFLQTAECKRIGPLKETITDQSISHFFDSSPRKEKDILEELKRD